MSVTTRRRKSVPVGIISRVDACSPGYRKALLIAAFDYFKQRREDFLALLGGLVASRHYYAFLKQQIEFAWAENLNLPREEREKKADVVARIVEEVRSTIAEELASDFPMFLDVSGRPLKIYVVTSPATNYDGTVGWDIAKRLSRLRPDIQPWGVADARIRLKGLKRPDGTLQDFRAALSVKAAWRSLYYSTALDRLVQDLEKQSSQPLPDLWVPGPGAAVVIRPPGEIARGRVSIPGLHRLQEITTAENQIGVGVLEFSGAKMPHVTIASFKDLTANERSFIQVVEGASQLEAQVIGELKQYPQTIGELDDALRSDRGAILDVIREHNDAGREPRVILDDTDKYDFEKRWMQKKLVYPVPDLSTLTIDSMVSFSCIHAGYRSTQYRWWEERVPEFILEQDARFLIGCGDYIAGLKHDLHLRGEIIAGLNYTQQQRWAAELLGNVMLKVFRVRMERALLALQSDPDEAKIAALVEAALMEFLWELGNHDLWLRSLGVDPIAYFELYIVDYLTQGIKAYLHGRKLHFDGVHDLARRHIHYGSEHVLPSGLHLGINHPQMARSQTSSLRAQQVLAARSSCHICQVGNFHTTKVVAEWNPELGERVAVENGSVLSGTEFEAGKLKVVDTGVTSLRVFSQNGRVFQFETDFALPDRSELQVCSEEEIFQAVRRLVTP